MLEVLDWFRVHPWSFWSGVLALLILIVAVRGK